MGCRNRPYGLGFTAHRPLGAVDFPACASKAFEEDVAEHLAAFRFHYMPQPSRACPTSHLAAIRFGVLARYPRSSGTAARQTRQLARNMDPLHWQLFRALHDRIFFSVGPLSRTQASTSQIYHNSKMKTHNFFGSLRFRVSSFR